MIRKLLNNQNGLVALMMTVILSILFLLVAYGMALFSLGEERRATDSDQSTRAFYAAESQIEASLLAVKTFINGGGQLSHYPTSPNCAGSNLGFGVGEDLIITCKIITINQSDSQVDLHSDQLQQYDLSAQGLSRLRISWWQDGVDMSSGTLGSPPDVELIGASYTDAGGGNIASGSIDVHNLVLRPSTGACGSAAPPSITMGGGGQPVVIKCTPINGTGQYRYQTDVTINGLGPSPVRWVISAKARKSSTHFMLQAYDNSGALISLPDQVLTIDVTARSGDTVYRRIVKKLNIRSGVFSGLDTVVFANRDVCKNLSVQTLANLAADNCP